MVDYLCAECIIFFLILMDSSINFDNKFSFSTIKVRNEESLLTIDLKRNSKLAEKFPSFYLPISDSFPK